jgi:hypothetical protein
MDRVWLRTGLACAIIGAAGLAASGLHAQALYKCAAADGSIAFQDRPCPADSTALPPPATTDMRGLAPEPGAYAAPQPAPATAVPAAPPTVVAPPALPALYRCQSADGKRYVSSNPTPPGRYVPLWTLDRWPTIEGRVGAPPPNSGRVGSTTPPPGGPGPGAGGGWPAALGAGYTWVQDQCYPMGRGELCAYWRSEIDRVGAARRIAFQDTRASLDGEYRDLHERFEIHCR